MRLLGRINRNHLSDVALKWISIFENEVTQTSWRRPEDIFKMYPRMEYLQKNIYRIPILDTNLHLILKICLANEIVVIKEVKSLN
ncbi:type II toxin-antitoxin system HigB family toxin [Acinetobacter haemolyticus]|uniref:type II toxin-antitoxin system HigB family toxin n=1 Tax=Acinetobacter TaxID=469 RepID=UPI000F73AA5C|nr:type II toxin-antitoxin system HigB family toxin [Acinetobacter haemolyticus]RSN73884.1 hypothetical protein EA769_14220 [Acinetobacter haemolyticus]